VIEKKTASIKKTKMAKKKGSPNLCKGSPGTAIPCKPNVDAFSIFLLSILAITLNFLVLSIQHQDALMAIICGPGSGYLFRSSFPAVTGFQKGEYIYPRFDNENVSQSLQNSRFDNDNVSQSLQNLRSSGNVSSLHLNQRSDNASNLHARSGPHVSSLLNRNQSHDVQGKKIKGKGEKGNSLHDMEDKEEEKQEDQGQQDLYKFYKKAAEKRETQSLRKLSEKRPDLADKKSMDKKSKRAADKSNSKPVGVDKNANNRLNYYSRISSDNSASEWRAKKSQMVNDDIVADIVARVNDKLWSHAFEIQWPKKGKYPAVDFLWHLSQHLSQQLAKLPQGSINTVESSQQLPQQSSSFIPVFLLQSHQNMSQNQTQNTSQNHSENTSQHQIQNMSNQNQTHNTSLNQTQNNTPQSQSQQNTSQNQTQAMWTKSRNAIIASLWQSRNISSHAVLNKVVTGLSLLLSFQSNQSLRAEFFEIVDGVKEMFPNSMFLKSFPTRGNPRRSVPFPVLKKNLKNNFSLSLSDVSVMTPRGNSGFEFPLEDVLPNETVIHSSAFNFSQSFFLRDETDGGDGNDNENFLAEEDFFFDEEIDSGKGDNEFQFLEGKQESSKKAPPDKKPDYTIETNDTDINIILPRRLSGKNKNQKKGSTGADGKKGSKKGSGSSNGGGMKGASLTSQDASSSLKDNKGKKKESSQNGGGKKNEKNSQQNGGGNSQNHGGLKKASQEKKEALKLAQEKLRKELKKIWADQNKKLMQM